ncbi:MAG: 6,7-dimethyl-8-ribityllumazine synthase [Lentisphaerales bacterium]|nr:MAG: 6,7-dimethyl-8-ribityllumazine synthase [Lentisphaerales bacterium]
MSREEIQGLLKADGIKACVVISRFNDFFTKQLLDGAVDCFVRHGGNENSLTVIWTPGANELPLVADRAAKSGKFSGLVALGAVVQGATRHAELINTQVSRSLAKTAMDTELPLINGVVCVDNLEQAIERCGTKSGNKGWTSMLALIEMVNLYKELGRGGK